LKKNVNPDAVGHKNPRSAETGQIVHDE